MHPRVLFAALRSRWEVMLGVALAALGVAFAYWAIEPAAYTATATLMSEVAEGSAGTVPGSEAAARTLAAQFDLLRSDRVTQRVVEDLRMMDSPSAQRNAVDDAAHASTVVEFLTRRLRQRATFRQVGNGGSMSVAVTAEDPEFAAQVADAYAPALGEVLSELRAAAAQRGAADAERALGQLRTRLDQAEARLASASGNDARAERGPDARLLADLDRLARLAFKAANSALPAAVATTPADPGAAPAVGDALALPAAVEGPVGRDAGGAWRAQRVALASAATTIGTGFEAPIPDAPTTAATPSLEALRAEVARAHQVLEIAQQRVAQRSAEALVVAFPVYLLAAAAVPTVPSTPGLATCLAAGLAAALVLGLAAVWACEVLDRRVRRPADLVDQLGIAVLGAVPHALVAAPVRPRRAGNRAAVEPRLAMRR